MLFSLKAIAIKGCNSIPVFSILCGSMSIYERTL